MLAKYVSPNLSNCWREIPEPTNGKLHKTTVETVVYPIIYKVLYIPGGAGYLPSTVCLGSWFSGSLHIVKCFVKWHVKSPTLKKKKRHLDLVVTDLTLLGQTWEVMRNPTTVLCIDPLDRKFFMWGFMIPSCKKKQHPKRFWIAMASHCISKCPV